MGGGTEQGWNSRPHWLPVRLMTPPLGSTIEV